MTTEPTTLVTQRIHQCLTLPVKERGLTEQNREGIQAMLLQVADITIATVLSDEGDLSTKKARLESMAQHMVQGVKARLNRGNGGVSGGYYRGWQDDRFVVENCEVERWARFAIWGAHGVNGDKSQAEVSQQGQADLLRGFFAAELARGQFSEWAFQGAGAFITLQLIAHIERKPLGETAAHYASVFLRIRQTLAEDEVAALDTGCASVNLLWDQQAATYVAI